MQVLGQKLFYERQDSVYTEYIQRACNTAAFREQLQGHIQGEPTVVLAPFCGDPRWSSHIFDVVAEFGANLYIGIDQHISRYSFSYFDTSGKTFCIHHQASLNFDLNFLPETRFGYSLAFLECEALTGLAHINRTALQDYFGTDPRYLIILSGLEPKQGFIAAEGYTQPERLKKQLWMYGSHDRRVSKALLLSDYLTTLMQQINDMTRPGDIVLIGPPDNPYSKMPPFDDTFSQKAYAYQTGLYQRS
jgi:hypothetical protein